MSENKTGKYVKYAIGEIFLVVIGILIAVAINSTYNKTQNKAAINTILAQIQKDLLIDIKDAERIFDLKMEKDSLARNIYFSTVTEEEFIENPYPLNITSNYVSFTTQKGGYNSLMQNLANLPDGYQFILPLLNNLYIERQNDIDDYNDFIKNLVMIKFRKNLYENPKIADYSLNISSKETLKFLFNYPFLKNQTMEYMNHLSNISIAANNYKIDAIKLYNKIDSLLGKNPDQTKLALLPKLDSIQPFEGVYMNLNDATDTLKYKVSIKKDHLLVSSSNTSSKAYWHKESYFFTDSFGGSIYYYKNKKNQRNVRISSARLVQEYINIEDIELSYD